MRWYLGYYVIPVCVVSVFAFIALLFGHWGGQAALAAWGIIGLVAVIIALVVWMGKADRAYKAKAAAKTAAPVTPDDPFRLHFNHSDVGGGADAYQDAYRNLTSAHPEWSEEVRASIARSAVRR